MCSWIFTFFTKCSQHSQTNGFKLYNFTAYTTISTLLLYSMLTPCELLLRSKENLDCPTDLSSAAIGGDNKNNRDLEIFLKQQKNVRNSFPQTLSKYLLDTTRDWSKDANLDWLNCVINNKDVKIIYVANQFIDPSKITRMPKKQTGTSWECFIIYQSKQFRWCADNNAYIRRDNMETLKVTQTDTSADSTGTKLALAESQKDITGKEDEKLCATMAGLNMATKDNKESTEEETVSDMVATKV